MPGFYFLPRVRLNKKDNVKKLNNFTCRYSKAFYKKWANDLAVDTESIAARKIVGEDEKLTEDVKNFLLATGEYGQEIQSDIDLYVTRRKHNKASFKRKLDPMEKNVWRKENHPELLFKDVSNFDAQNLVIGSLIREIDIGKKDTLSKLLEPQIPTR